MTHDRRARPCLGRRRGRLHLAAFLALALTLTGLRAGEAPATVAVLNFANTHTGSEPDPHRWLAKGMADLLISDLALSRQLRVVTREDMQVLLQEARLADDTLGPHGPDDSSARLKPFLSVDQLVFCTYTVTGTAVLLRTQVIDQKSGKMLAEFSQEGELANVLELEKALATRMLAYFEAGEPQGPPRVLPRWTDSVPASQRLYEGMDLFDRGEFTLAWQAFRLALAADPNYADARYWLARMFYYRQEYEHAALEYETFVFAYPKHGRIGDAIMEFVHSREYASDDPDTLRQLYRALQALDWKDVRVHNQTSYASTSPLADWVLKREQQVLLFQKKYAEAFALLGREFDDAEKNNPTGEDRRKLDARAQDPADWRTESSRLMAALAELSEDHENIRLASPHLPYVDLEFPLDNPMLDEDLRGTDLKGVGYRWGANHRILAPTGTCIRTVTARIRRTNDPDQAACCRLQIRRYRYVDIHTCWTEDRKPGNTNYVFKLTMPPGCTWFYLRPEYMGAPRASFDGWTLEAELAPLPEAIGRLDVQVRNLVKHRSLVDGVYARCFHGVIANLAPGPHELRVENMFGTAGGVAPLVTNVTVEAGRTLRLDLDLALDEKVRAAGWHDPLRVADEYPVFKLRPQRPSNWRSGRPSLCVDRRTGRKLAVWSHLDDVWLATSEDGLAWAGPLNVPPPVNSAHVELQPRLIQDEQGRFCLLFLSDRGVQRSLASYACWSRDLRQWSRPVMISPETLDDHDFLQAADGQYVFIGTRQDPANPQADSIRSHVSRDLVAWSAPRRWPVLGSPEALCLRQDRQGLFHLMLVQSEILHLVSDNLQKWKLQHVLPRPKTRYGGTVGMAVVDDGLVAVIGSRNEQYGAAEVVHLLWLPLRRDGAPPRVLSPPRGVMDGLCDLVFDPGAKEVLFAWQATSMQLNTVLPAGPIYGLWGRPKIWQPPEKEEKKEGGHD